MVAVIKLGGSVLTGLDAFPRAASSLADRLADNPSLKLVVVVSAEHGATDNLLALAESVGANPDVRALDLLWATGELRSVALLTLALQARGVDAVGLNVHETGITCRDAEDLEAQRRSGTRRRRDAEAQRNQLRTLCASAPLRLCVRSSSLRLELCHIDPQRLNAALTLHRILVVPGFLARGDGDSIVSLGRGGSDLTAVLLAIALRATECELIKNVPGYFTADPAFDSGAQHISALTYDAALDRARRGCRVVQCAALEAAARAGLPIRVRSLDITSTSTLVSSPGYRNDAGLSAPSVSEAWQAVGVGPHGNQIEETL